MGLIQGMDNSVLFVFMVIMGFILYIFWTIVNKISERSPNNQQDRYDFNRIPEGESDPYANTNQHDDCPICTDRIRYKVELDCRHNFCGKCIMDYYDTLRPGCLKCPLCRQNNRYINYENLVRDNGTREFYDKIVIYNHRNLQGFYSFSGYISDFSYFFYRGISDIFSDALLIFYFLIFLVVVIYYFLSPADIIPDTLGLIGYLDDVSLVGILAVWVVQRFYARFRQRVEAEFHQIESQ